MSWIKKVASTPLATVAKVIDSLTQSTNDRFNAPSIRATREAIQAVATSQIYPVGSVYISVYNTNPATMFGGTWTQLKDKFLVGAGDTFVNGSTGGASSRSYTPSGTVGGHKLTLGEMPSHKHGYYGQSFYNSEQGALPENDHFAQPTYSNTLGLASATKNTYFSGGQSTTEGDLSRLDNSAHNHSFTGTQATIETLPPYLTVYMWVRTA